MLYVVTLTPHQSGVDCPDGWYKSSVGENSHCCPGSSFINDDSGYCCLQVNNFQRGSDHTVAFPSCFPFCRETETEYKQKRVDIPKPSCAARIDFGDADYTSKVSSASKSLASKYGGGGKTDAPATNSANATGTGSSAKPTSTIEGTSDISDSSEADESTNNARSFPTADLLRGAAAAAAFLAL